MMTYKLIVSNLRRNIKDYAIYFLTLTLAVALFYAFNSVTGAKALGNLNSELLTMIDAMGQMIKLSSVTISVLFSFLILYVNRFLLKRRKKELGIYMLLGMKKGKISSIFVGETVLIGILSLVSGIIIGIFLSQLLTVAAIRVFGGHVNDFSLNFSMQGLKITLVCFTVVYIIAMLFNVICVSKVKLLDLLLAERKNEELKTRKNFVYVIAFMAGIIFLILTALCFNTGELLPQKELLFAGMAFAALATLLIFYSTTSVLLVLIRRQKHFYLKNINCFLVRQISTRIQGNFISMSVVCILLTITIILLTTGVSIAMTMSRMSDDYAPYDFILMMEATEDETDVLEEAKNYEYGYDFGEFIASSFQMNTYKADITYGDVWHDQDVVLWEHDAGLTDKSIQVCSISDYNKCLVAQGYEPLTLDDDEFLINCNYTGTYKYMEHFLEKSSKLTVADATLYPASKELLHYVYQLTSIGDNDRGTLIVSDAVAEKCAADAVFVQGFWKLGTDTDKANTKLNELTTHEDHPPFIWNSKVRMTTMYYSALGLPVFLFTYIGLIFLLICVALISAQQLTEISDNQARYLILRKQGVSEKMMSHTIYKQVGVYFIAPLFLAISYTTVSLKSVLDKVSRFYNMEIGAYIWITVLLMALFYGGYYLVTSASCVRMICDRKNLLYAVNYNCKGEY
ncbi:ABC transporter permease [Petroclostridium sp. X23]|uniref:ABC transporter permease n=1 Tax=Petroclostridium sp. X23 TaxID=3045146 RepID=UPI0024AC8CD4|nr:ABC transporter permease [Petroclostridium sp. X23]WHH60640.1 ABC transporter permease [Petroclostridium sp. X23]